MAKVGGRTNPLRAPFPYFGGKSAVADLIWQRLGDVPNFVEPFAGSLAVLLARSTRPGIETVNDLDGHVTNVWRAIKYAPEDVAWWTDMPVDELTLHAAHLKLVNATAELTERLIADPRYYDAELAGYWIWGKCCWIGSGWCSGKGPWRLVDGRVRKDPARGMGVYRRLPHLGDGGCGVNRKLPHLGDGGRGVRKSALGRVATREWLRGLSDRLARARITCGDWTRVLGPSVTTRLGRTGVLLDPPYAHAHRDGDLYTHDYDVFHAVREWALANGDDPKLRIVLCGYDFTMPDGWEIIRWKARGGYGSQGHGRGRANANKETIAFSPHCLKPAREPLFANLDAWGEECSP